MKYNGIIIKNIIEVTCTLIISIVLLIVIFKCNEIPTHVTDLRSEDIGTTTQLTLGSNPYTIKHLFSLHDISIEEYVYLLPSNVGRRPYFFSRNYEGAEWSDTGQSLSATGEDLLFVFSNSSEISFYSKLLFSENLQTIRTFFLTEIFTFFIAILCSNSYNLFLCLYRRKHGKGYYFSKRAHLKLSVVYSVLSVIAVILIVIICKSPIRDVNDCSYHVGKEPSMFAPYDISQTYYRMKIEPSNLNCDTIVWSSNEIVKFSNMQNEPKLKSSKSLTFTQFDKSKTFTNDFYTTNLVSKNLQEIRLFLLTTILLLFMARCFVHLKASLPRYALFKSK